MSEVNVTEIKTLNGYPLADTKARADIAALSEENALFNAELEMSAKGTKNLNGTKYVAGTSKGLSWVVNDDNSITFSGNQTGEVYLLPTAEDRQKAGFYLPAGTYTVSGGISWNTAAYICLYNSQADTTSVGSHWAYANPATFTTDRELFVVVQIVVATDNVDGVTMRVQLESGSSATEYVSPWGEEKYSARLNNLNKRVEALENIVVGQEIPAYYVNQGYLSGKAARINALGEQVGGNGDVFMVITDQHWQLNAKRSPSLMRYLYDACRIPRLFSLGDIDHGLNADYVNLLRAEYGGDIHYAVGNHEYEQDTTNSALAYHWDMGKASQIGNAERHYYYVDNQQQKLRYIVLSGYDEGDDTNYCTRGYEAEQLAWLADDALDMQTGWSAIVFTHNTHYYAVGEGFGQDYSADMLAVLDAAVDKVIVVISGHTHKDAVFHTTGGIPIVILACDKYQPFVDSNGLAEFDASTRKVDTITEQAFDVVVLDKTARKLTFVRIGAPADNMVDGTSTGTVEERVVTY